MSYHFYFTNLSLTWLDLLQTMPNRIYINFNKMCWKKAQMCTCRRLKLDFLSHQKFSYTWTQNFNIKPETLKLLEEDIRNTLQDKSIGKDYLDRKLVVQEIRLTVHKLNFMKLKVSIKQRKLQKIFDSYIPNRGLVPIIHKELQN